MVCRREDLNWVTLDEMELVDPIEWQYDGRGTFGSAEARAAVAGLGGSEQGLPTK